MGWEILVAIPASGGEEKEETIVVEKDSEEPQESVMWAESQDISAFHILETIFGFRNVYG